ncbi:hypothetical protein F5Y14DRAFT_202412 [Nemania sp. NC0429]|nr:hypothetical protein F5Y14DRAFT_202412 [Nemania sp. NC0429]
MYCASQCLPLVSSVEVPISPSCSVSVHITLCTFSKYTRTQIWSRSVKRNTQSPGTNGQLHFPCLAFPDSSATATSLPPSSRHPRHFNPSIYLPTPSNLPTSIYQPCLSLLVSCHFIFLLHPLLRTFTCIETTLRLDFVSSNRRTKPELTAPNTFAPLVTYTLLSSILFPLPPRLARIRDGLVLHCAVYPAVGLRCHVLPSAIST